MEEWETQSHKPLLPHSSSPSLPLSLSPLLLFLLALLIRCIGLRWGLPSAEHYYSYHPDERQIAGAVASMVSGGDLNPHFFNYPSLYIYLTYFVNLFSLVQSLESGASPPAWMFLRDIIFAGRVVTAVLGAATVPLVFAIGHEIGGRRLGLLAALLMALLPGHVQHSHFATVDVPATFFVTLSLWLAVRALRQSTDDAAPSARWRLKQLLWAAAVAGLAAATKYNAGLVLVAPLTALYLLGKDERFGSSFNLWKHSAMMLGIAALGFVIGCPYSVLSFREFWGDGRNNGFAYELLVHPRQGHGETFIATGNGWWYHLTFNLPFVMTWPVWICALAGALCSMFVLMLFPPVTPPSQSPVQNGKGSDFAAVKLLEPIEQNIASVTMYLPLIAWISISFASLGISHVRFMRYTLPLMPALCVFVAVGVGVITGIGVVLLTLRLQKGKLKVKQMKQTKTLGFMKFATLIVHLIVLPGTLNVLYPFVMPDPRDQAAQFLARQKHPATVGLVNPPWFWTPPLTPQDAPPGSGLIINYSPDGRYRFVIIGFDATRLKNERLDWIVMNEFEWRESARLQNADFQAFMKHLEQSYALKQTFKNVPPLALPGRDFVPHDYLYPNPAVRVYQRR